MKLFDGTLLKDLFIILHACHVHADHRHVYHDYMPLVVQIDRAMIHPGHSSPLNARRASAEFSRYHGLTAAEREAIANQPVPATLSNIPPID